MHNIKKRNGDVVPFNSKKISDAIYKANLESVDETFSANQLAARETVLERFDLVKCMRKTEDLMYSMLRK